MDLNSPNLFKVFVDCQRKDGEAGEDIVSVRGVAASVFLHKKRLEQHKYNIASMLDKLPDEFHASKGGWGQSMLSASITKDGYHWCHSHRELEALFILGMGAGLVKCPVPRDLWTSLPDGLPHYCVTV